METEQEKLAEAERLWSAVDEDPRRQRSVALYRELAEKHATPMAIYRMGCAHAYGLGAEQDPEAAMRWLTHPSIRGWRSVLLMRGEILASPSFPGHDAAAARQCLTEAARLGLKDQAAPLLARLDAENLLSADYVRSAPRHPDCLDNGVVAAIYRNACTLCGFPLERIGRLIRNCPACQGAPRTRALPLFMQQYLRPWLARIGPLPDLPLLGFAMTVNEEKILRLAFPAIRSVSLYGAYGEGHEIGVDARDLSRYADRSFCGSFSVLTWDFFLEQERAIAEAARTIAPGGVLMHQFSTTRVLTGNIAPQVDQVIQKTKHYYTYLPDDHTLVSIKFGIDWYVAALERAGFDAHHVSFPDPHTGGANHWFLGVRNRS